MMNELDGSSRFGNWQEAMASGGDAIAHYWLTAQAYIDGQASGASFDAALWAMDEWEPAACRYILRKVIAMYHDGGAPNEDRQAALVAAAQRAIGND